MAARQALILSLGEFTDQQLSAAQRRPLVDILLRWYRNDPDPGIHGAIEWLLRNNGFGLFDIYGNVWEWLQDRRQEYPPSMIIVQDLEDTVLIVQESEARARRDGSFAYGAEVMRSAHRGFTTYFPMQRRDNVGFRIGRTLR